MKKGEGYDLNFEQTHEKIEFHFISVGSKGSIEKVIEFQQTSLKFWNLGFGDAKEGDWEDDIISDNGDLRKVLQTVTNSVHLFFSIKKFMIILELRKKHLYLTTKINQIMTIEDKNKVLLENAKAMSIPLRLMTAAEKTKVADMAKKSFYKPKYLQALKVTTQLDVREYCQIHEDASAKDVLIEIMKTYSPSIPPDILLDMAQVILSEWKAMQTTHNKLVVA